MAESLSGQNGILDIPSVRDHVSDEEWRVRCELAAAYRLIAHFGWDDLIYTHISARVPGPEHHFLMNPMGLMFDEITASSLVKIDLDGNKVMDSPFGVNKAGFTIHSAVHAARENALCALHLHTDAGIAVSNLAEGLLPLAQSSLIPYVMHAYHDYEGFAVRPDEKKRLVASLGDNNVLILRNHGTMTVGSSIGQAFELAYFLEKACRIQLMTMSSGMQVQNMSDKAYQTAVRDMYAVLSGDTSSSLCWAALMRKADRLDPTYRS